jgi:monoamine oxidase
VCSFRKSSSSFDVRANDVLLTIPFTMLREVRIDVPMPPAKQRAIGELGYGTNAKLMVGFTERVWRERWGSNGSVLTDLAFQQVWETSRKQPGASGILTNFTGGRHGVELGQGTATSQATMLVSQLLQVFPGIAIARTEAREARMHWPSNPFVRGSYACYKPGQWTALRGAEAEPVGRLYFAGEHCSLVAQGFMEGACETGLAAARRILATRGLQPGPARLSRRALLLRR